MHVPKVIRRLRDNVRQAWNSAADRFDETTEPLRDEYHRIRDRLLEIEFLRWIDGSIRKMGQHDTSFMAAGMAYYAVLALFPLILGIIALWGIFLPSESVQDRLFDFFESNFPGSTDFLEENITGTIAARGALGAVSVVGLLWAGSGMFGAMTRAINRAWDAESRHYVLRKLQDLGMVLGVGALLILSVGLMTAVGVFSETTFVEMNTPLKVGFRVLGFLLNLGIFLSLYKFIPNVKTRWRHVWPGALIAAILFEVVDVEDPIEVGGETTYEIRVLNQGSKAALNVEVGVLFPPEMQPVAAEGPPGIRQVVEGSTVRFDALSRGVDPEGRSIPAACGLRFPQAHHARRWQVRVRIAVQEAEDAVLARIHSSDEGGPGHRRFGGIGRVQAGEDPIQREARKVGQVPTRHPLLH